MQRFKALVAFGSCGEEQDCSVWIIRGLGECEQNFLFEQLCQGFLPAVIFGGGHVIEQNEELHNIRGNFLSAEQFKIAQQQQDRVPPEPNTAINEVGWQFDAQIIP